MEENEDVHLLFYGTSTLQMLRITPILSNVIAMQLPRRLDLKPEWHHDAEGGRGQELARCFHVFGLVFIGKEARTQHRNHTH